MDWYYPVLGRRGDRAQAAATGWPPTGTASSSRGWAPAASPTGRGSPAPRPASWPSRSPRPGSRTPRSSSSPRCSTCATTTARTGPGWSSPTASGGRSSARPGRRPPSSSPRTRSPARPRRPGCSPTRARCPPAGHCPGPRRDRRLAAGRCGHGPPVTAPVHAPPTSTVVVASQNRREELLTTLPRHEAPVVLVDNASTDGTAEAVRAAHPEVTVIALDRNVGARARTVGVRRAGTPFVAFADDDSWWAPGDLARAVDDHAGAPPPGRPERPHPGRPRGAARPGLRGDGRQPAGHSAGPARPGAARLRRLRRPRAHRGVRGRRRVRPGRPVPGRGGAAGPRPGDGRLGDGLRRLRDRPPPPVPAAARPRTAAGGDLAQPGAHRGDARAPPRPGRRADDGRPLRPSGDRGTAARRPGPAGRRCCAAGRSRRGCGPTSPGWRARPVPAIVVARKRAHDPFWAQEGALSALCPACRRTARSPHRSPGPGCCWSVRRRRRRPVRSPATPGASATRCPAAR